MKKFNINNGFIFRLTILSWFVFLIFPCGGISAQTTSTNASTSTLLTPEMIRYIYKNYISSSTVSSSESEMLEDIERANNNQNISECYDGIDNDSDKFTDFPADPGCDDLYDNDETQPISAKVSPAAYDVIGVDKFTYLGNGGVALSVNNGFVTILNKSVLSIIIPKRIFSKPPSNIYLSKDGVEELFINKSDLFRYDLLVDSASPVKLKIIVNQFSGLNYFLDLSVVTVPRGVINCPGSCSGAEVSLYHQKNGLVKKVIYGDSNPFITNEGGFYGWMVANGDYYISVKKNGYLERTIFFEVNNRIVNKEINLIEVPKKMVDRIEPESSDLEKVLRFVQEIIDYIKYLPIAGLQEVSDNADNPGAERTAGKVIAPISIGVVAVGLAPFIAWIDFFFPLLRLIFIQSRVKKRQQWGVVYNSLNKQPIDLVVVRLIGADSEKVVQTKVTDLKGRFFFIVEPGKYILSLEKRGYVFPSDFLEGQISDGKHHAIYTSGVIWATSSNTIIAKDVPMDPVGVRKPVRFKMKKFRTVMAELLSWVGFGISAVAFYIYPKWYIGLILAAHLLLYYIFKTTSKKIKHQNWGIVSDLKTGAPLAKSVVRLFNSKLNKLVDSEVTDNNGRYNFLAGDDQYYITCELAGYKPYRSDHINLIGRSKESIAINIVLEKIL